MSLHLNLSEIDFTTCSLSGRTLLKKEINIGGISYWITKQLGQGGQGTVFLVESGNQQYAIKIIQLHKEDTKENKIKNERLRKEVEYCTKFHSQNVIQIISSEEKNVVKDKSSFKQLQFVMPYFKSTLRDWISGKKSIELKFNLLYQLYEAISTIHADGVVHRDIKPENVLIDPNNLHLVLSDFGIAHFSSSGKTLTKELLANRAYFAPEQMKGQNQRDVGPAADIFALGLITNELFTLHVPRGGSFKQISDVHPLLSGLDSLVERMICQDPDKRISIDSAKSELKKISCTYGEFLSKTKDFLKRFSMRDWNDRLEGMKQVVLDRKIAEKLLNGTGQQEIDSYIATHVGRPPQNLSEIEKTQWKIYNTQCLIEDERDKYICENILNQSSELELKSIEEGIYRQAAEEVILANQLLKTLSTKEWQSINPDYHCNILFHPNKNLVNAAQSIYFLKICREKFNYESNVYKSISGSKCQSAYDKGPTEEQRSRLDVWLSKRNFSIAQITDANMIHGRIRKYFISCGNYHCEELLETMETIRDPWDCFSSEESAIRLAYGVTIYLISNIYPNEDNREYLASFDLLDFIKLSNVTDWPLETFLKRNENASNLVLEPSLDTGRAVEILENLKNRFGGVNFEIRESTAVVNFVNQKSYNQFRREAREKSKGHYTFEGDVIDILVPVFSGEGLVQFIWKLGFDVKHTLAMILGLREIE